MGKPGRKAKAYSQTARVMALRDHLAGRRYGATVRELAEHFHISDRQVRRDVGALIEAGHPIERERVGDEARVLLREGRPGAVHLTLRERYALLAVRRVFDLLPDTPFGEDVRSIFDKVAASLPEKDQGALDELVDRFVYLPDGGRKPYEDHADVIDGLMTAVIYRWRVAAEYRSARGNLWRGTIAPYAMALYRQGLYVVGPRDDEDLVRVYAVERFVQVEPLRGERFERPADFDVDAFFDGFGVFTGGKPTKVLLEFTEDVAHLVRDRIWHPSQRLRRAPRGVTRIELEVPNTPQLLQWIVGWGPKVRVIEPAELRDAVRDEYRRALERE